MDYFTLAELNVLIDSQIIHDLSDHTSLFSWKLFFDPLFGLLLMFVIADEVLHMSHKPILATYRGYVVLFVIVEEGLQNYVRSTNDSFFFGFSRGSFSTFSLNLFLDCLVELFLWEELLTGSFSVKGFVGLCIFYFV
jgi:hypothetical protein